MNIFKTLAIFLVIMNGCNSLLMASYEKKIDAIVNQALEEFHVPGAAIGLVIENKILMCRGYGMRDLEHGLPVTANTIFPIASNTKAFTSFLLGQLVEEGTVAWDDPVIKHIPEFRLFNEELTSQITLRDLIAHRTGIPRHDALWYLFRDMSEEDVLNALPHFPPVSRIGETFQYNNLMYVVAGRVIYNVTGNTWEQEISSRILTPLEMNRSGTSAIWLQTTSEVSKPYAEIEGTVQKIPFLYPCSTLAASAIHSSVSDMIKWLQVLLFESSSSNFIQDETLKEMYEIQMPIVETLLLESDSPITPSGYGLGWKIDTYRKRKNVHHDGIIDGFFSRVSLLPNEKIGLVILTNSSSDGHYAVTYIEKEIFDLLLGVEDTTRLHKMLEQRSKEKSEAHALPLRKYEGNYTHPAYGIIQITQEHDCLMATFGKTKVSLNPKGEGIFEAKFSALLTYGKNPLVEFSFFSNAAGELYELHVPFEHFHSAPPIIFKKAFSIL